MKQIDLLTVWNGTNEVGEDCKMQGNKRVILVAVVGVSPAVLTETVWAMAHGAIPIVPDQICVVTTAAGKKRVEDNLLSGRPTIWDRLLSDLKNDNIAIPLGLRFGRASIVVVPDEYGNEAEDLRCAGDNMRAADTMLETLRKYTEDPGTIVYASIAGGRKSMGALMLSCMSLLGRADDRVTHVLTRPDATEMVSVKDGARFYYPKRGHRYLYGPVESRQRIAADKVGIELFDIPFVRMRGWYQEKFKTIPPSYGMLVNAVQQESPIADVLPMVSLDLMTGVVMIGDEDCPVGVCGAAVLYCYLSGTIGLDDVTSLLNAISALKTLPKDKYQSLPKWIRRYLGTKRSGRGGLVDEGDIIRMVSDLRGKLSRRLNPTYVERLCPKNNRISSYPRDRMSVLNPEVLDGFCR